MAAAKQWMQENREILRFLILLAGMMGLFYLFEWIIDQFPRFYYYDLLKYYVIYNGVDVAEWMLRVTGYELLPFDQQNYFQVLGGSQLKVGIPCSGFELFVFYAIMILAYPGPWKLKLIFIPSGILAIHLINIARFYALAMSDLYSREYFELHHHFIFKAVVYIFIFVIWMWFVSLSAKRAKRKKAAA
jgi:exosortase/archaeosortase family protein